MDERMKGEVPFVIFFLLLVDGIDYRHPDCSAIE
jgi:hypothetical protein